MKTDQLTAYLISIKRSKPSIKRAVGALKAFETWLSETQDLTIDDEITVALLTTFIQSVQKGKKNLLLGLSDVFDFQQRENLKNAALEMRRAILDKQVKPMRLKDFLGVDQTLLTRLEARGLRDAWQLLRVCKTPADRQKLARQLDVPYNELLDLVKMADLSRMRAVKAVRTRLYLESGFDTLDILAAQDPMELHLGLVKFVEESGFDGIATLPKEAIATVKSAGELERWIQFVENE